MTHRLPTWKRVAISLRDFHLKSHNSQVKSLPTRALRLETLQPRKMLAADAGAGPALQYTGGAPIAGQFSAQPQPDVNQDGNVTALDALLVANALNNGVSVAESPQMDVNQDLNLSVADFDTVIAAIALHASANASAEAVTVRMMAHPAARQVEQMKAQAPSPLTQRPVEQRQARPVEQRQARPMQQRQARLRLAWGRPVERLLTQGRAPLIVLWAEQLTAQTSVRSMAR